MTLAEQVALSSQLAVSAHEIEFWLEANEGSIPERREKVMRHIADLLRQADAALWIQQRRTEVLAAEVENRRLSELRSKEMFDKLAQTML